MIYFVFSLHNFEKIFVVFFFFFKQKTAYEMLRSLVGSEMCIRDSMYSDLPSYMPSYKDLLDRKSRKVDTMGREVRELQGTRADVAQSMIPPRRLGTAGYRPAPGRDAQPHANIGAGWGKSVQDASNNHSHQGNYYGHNRFERTQHSADWRSWTREEHDPVAYKVRRHGDEEYGDGHMSYGHHASKSPPGARNLNRTTATTVNAPRSHGDVVKGSHPLRTM
eukprot:TRINITY_DN1766_c0_g1_i3.p1 TRINITY_DN1766_c0_g1~~TRINITY_DN1766_c0_g1_i3.p1  ORF type:complete len:221 (-),score=55.85 TRINITY_DN1766_c0_g1_i3:387-1049(-)